MCRFKVRRTSVADRVRLLAPLSFHRLSVRPPGSQPGKAGSTPAGSTIFCFIAPIQLAVQATGLSSRGHGFKSRWERHIFSAHRPDGGTGRHSGLRNRRRQQGMQVQILLGAPILGNRLMVGRLALTQATVVRPHVPHPNLQHRVCSSTGRALDF